MGTTIESSWENERLKEQLAAAQARENELVAHVERLRDALQMPCDRWSKHQHKIVKEALESTPAQSLAHLRNGVLEEAAKKMDRLLQEWAGTSSANDDYRHAYKCAGQSIRAMKEQT